MITSHHHHHVMSSARISLTLSLHPSLSSIRSSGLHPVSAQSCCMEVRAGRPAFAHPCEEVHRSTSLMRSSLLLGLLRLILIVFVMGGNWQYSCCLVGCCLVGCCLVGCCLHYLFNIARNILVQLPSSFFSIRLVSAQVVHPYSSINTIATWKKLRFILSIRSDFHMTDNLSVAIHAFASRVLMSVSVDETLLPRWVNLSTSFRELPFSGGMSPG